MSVNLLMTLKTLNRCRPQTWRNESSVSVKWKRTKSAGKEILFLKFIKNAINSGDYPPVTAPFFPQNSQCSFKEQKGKQLEGYMTIRPSFYHIFVSLTKFHVCVYTQLKDGRLRGGGRRHGEALLFINAFYHI